MIFFYQSIVNVLLSRRSSPSKNYTNFITNFLAHILALVSRVEIKLEAVVPFSR
jgi:hypothetical protein